MTMKKFGRVAASTMLVLSGWNASAASQGDIDLAVSAVAQAKYQIALAAACGVPLANGPNPRLERFAAALEIGQKGLKEKLSPQDFEVAMKAASSEDMGVSIAKKTSEGVASGACKDKSNLEAWDFLAEAAKFVK